MNKSLKVLLSLLLSLVLLSTCLIGCTKNNSSSEISQTTLAATTNSAATSAAETENAELGGLKLPLVDKPLTLTYYLTNLYPTVMKSYNDMKVYQIQEQDTGIHIDFIHPAAGQEADQLNLLIASNELPDIIEINPLNYAGGPGKLLQDGTAVDLKEMIDQYAPNIKKVFQDYSGSKKLISTDEGNIYCFPWLCFYDNQLVYMGHIIREDWLEKLALKMPETIDDWYNVLKAFKEKDPNGNQKNDEIPYISIKHDRILPFSYAWGITADFYDDNSVIKYGPMQPVFKEYLSIMRKWYSEGLIDPDFASTDSKQFDAKATGDIGGAFYGYAGGGIRKYMTSMAGTNPEYKLAGTSYPVLQSGQKPPVGHRIYSFNGNGAAVISSKNKHQKETVQWFDYNYSPKGYMLYNYGIEGETYTMNNGTPSFVEKITGAANGFMEELTKVNRFVGSGPWVHAKEAQDQYMSLPAQRVAIATWSNTEKSCFLPPITPTQDESLRLTAIMSEINTYMAEMVNKFIMGQESVDSFDKYVESLKKMNIEEAIKIKQAAFDRYNKR